MAIRPASAFGAGKDDDRISGFTLASGSVLYGGNVVSQDPADATGKTLKIYNGQQAVSAAYPPPLGLVYENTNPFSSSAAAGADSFAGVGFDNLDYARGGIYSVFHRPGNLVEIFDDKRNTTGSASCPFVSGDTFSVGAPVYSTTTGLLTITATSATCRIGYVRGATGSSGVNQVFTLELAIAPMSVSI